MGIASTSISAAEHVIVDDDPFLRIVQGCVHEQKVHSLQRVESANKNTVFVMLVGLAKRFEA